MKRKWLIENGVFGLEEDTKMISVFCDHDIDFGYCYYDDIINSRLNLNEYIVRSSTRLLSEDILKKYEYINYCQYYKVFNNIFLLRTWEELKENEVTNYVLSNRFFVRPNSGAKIFTGTTVGKKWLHKEIECIEKIYDIPNETLVIISTEKNIESEYRVVIYHPDNNNDNIIVVDSSHYGGIELDKKLVEQFALDQAKYSNYKPSTFYTIDVCRSNGELFVLEINHLLTAGWYDCDYEKIITLVNTHG